jgi:hypothetical protein
MAKIDRKKITKQSKTELYLKTEITQRQKRRKKQNTVMTEETKDSNDRRNKRQ